MKKAALAKKKGRKAPGGDISGDAPEDVFSDEEYEKTLKSAEQVEKSSSMYFFIAAGIILILLILIIVSGVYIRQHLQDKNEYNHFKFVKNGLFWETMIQKEGVLTAVPFYYHPHDLESIATEPRVAQKILNFTRNGTIFITLNPDMNASVVKAGVQVARITGERFGILGYDTRSAITNAPRDWNGSENLTTRIVTCKDASDTVLVIWLVKGETEALFSKNNCIIVEARDEEQMVKVAEKLDYLLLGIMN